MNLLGRADREAPAVQTVHGDQVGLRLLELLRLQWIQPSRGLQCHR